MNTITPAWIRSAEAALAHLPNRTTESHIARAADITRRLAAGLSVELLIGDDEWLPIASARAEDGIVWLTFRCGASGWLGGDYSLRTKTNSCGGDL